MDSPAAFIAPLLSFGVLVVLVLLQWHRIGAKRGAENKVRTADHILLADIKILARMNSRLLEDAVVLRCSQKE